MKKKTVFGIFFKNLRNKNNQTISDAAKILDVSISYISLVESGERQIPSSWRSKIIEIYKLNEKEIVDLDAAICATNSSKTISIEEVEQAFSNMIESANIDEESKNKLYDRLFAFINKIKLK